MRSRSHAVRARPALGSWGIAWSAHAKVPVLRIKLLHQINRSMKQVLVARSRSANAINALEDCFRVEAGRKGWICEAGPTDALCRMLARCDRDAGAGMQCHTPAISQERRENGNYEDRRHSDAGRVGPMD
jgi:hypothetical protein